MEKKAQDSHRNAPESNTSYFPSHSLKVKLFIYSEHRRKAVHCNVSLEVKEVQYEQICFIIIM